MARRILFTLCLTIIFTVGLVALLPSAGAQSDTPPQGVATPAGDDAEAASPFENMEGDEKAIALLQAMSAHYADIERMSGRMKQIVDIEAGGREQHIEQTIEFATAPGGKARLTLEPGDPREVTMVSDGEQLVEYDGRFNVYATTERQGPQIPRAMLMGPVMDGMPFAEPPFEGLSEIFSKVEYVGAAVFDDREAHEIKLTGKLITSSMWISHDKDQPMLLGATIDRTAMLRAQGQDGKFELSMRFTDIKTGDAVHADTFTFTPPEGAKQVDALPQSTSDLVGWTAPEIELPLLSGEQFKLSDHLNKGKVIVLEFWATWCPPCRAALPMFQEIDDEMDRVQVIAINSGESKENASGFVAATGLDLAVPLDTSGAVSELFFVQSLPTTIVISPSGEIIKAHSGFVREAALRAALEEVVEKHAKNAAAD